MSNHYERVNESRRANHAGLSLLSADNASYNVFPLPIEAPSFGSRSIITNPWDLTSSPEGWHSDGTNHYTITRGNNVHAYADMGATNNIGYSPNGGASVDKASIGNVFLGVVLFHTLFIVAPTVGTMITGNSMVGEYFRVFISYAVITVALIMYEVKKRKEKSNKSKLSSNVKQDKEAK